MLPILSSTRNVGARTPANRLRSYGIITRLVQSRTCQVAATILVIPVMALAILTDRGIAADAIKIVAFGDSLTAGFGLPATDSFPSKLQNALKARGHAVEILNAGVSGDTALGGLARLDWSVPDETDALILELGANDALRGIDPSITRDALNSILTRLKERGIPVLLCGMRAPPNMGANYTKAFDSIFPELAAEHDALLYPFFLEGIAANRLLNQSDGLHPTAAGIDAIVDRILPKVEELIVRAKTKRQ